MKLVWSFSDTPAPANAVVGGKGFSLVKMSQAGLAVPPGFVLSVDFFNPWISTLEQTTAWRDLARAQQAVDPDAALAASCAALKTAGADLALSAEQQQMLDAALGAHPPESLFAVRSSSPEEDLEGSSFAGGYETVLGVTVAGLPEAIRRAFLSCLDVRVAIYKREHGFDVTRPRIAVVVQRQIASEIAGVGFSVNPISNAYDEAVYSSNWGLGETVVAGLASPDTFVVDKASGEIVERAVGNKETSMWLQPDGGTVERPDPRHDELTLSDEQVLALTEQLQRIEALYEKPMDIEWAVAGGELFLLQARPITTVVQLPAELVTEPGEQRRLYLDITISVQGLFEPMSVLGTSIIREVMTASSKRVFGTDLTRDIDSTVVYLVAGRIYGNISNMLLLVGKKRWTEAFSVMDPVAAAAVAAIEGDQYVPESYPKKSAVLGFLNNIPDKAINLIEGRLMPAHARRGCDKKIERFRQRLKPLRDADEPMLDLAQQAYGHATQLIFDELVPLVATARRAFSKMKDLCEPLEGVDGLVDSLDLSLPGNVTVEMGLSLEELAEHLRELDPLPTADDLARGLETRALPASFLQAWAEFLDRYGHRGPGELDAANPRYRDEPDMLLAQIAQLCRLEDPADGPVAIFERSQGVRHQAFETLTEAIHEHYGWLQTKRFQSLYKVLETLGALRESGKYFIVMIMDMLRQRALAHGKALHAAGRLDNVQQVFDLEIADVDRAVAEPELDLRKLAAERRLESDRLRAVAELPRVIDSRGRIIRPPRPEAREGELAGQAVSAGQVRGPVKVLAEPDEKPLLPGDILVARATDPGWTPLFVNAAAIVLEVGGLLQHGALVAREYGKPCVAGVTDATKELRDGTMVEVDGAAGIVRLLDEGAADQG